MIDQEVMRRVDAYRGNPQALMQKYQQSQQLIDLLALQKLKSEKEAAARSLQMSAGQGTPPTVAQQREQEVFGMTQKEVAQQVGAAAQQRAIKEREAIQRLMSGVAAAPGAAGAMPEQAMAAGGIVAFQSGGYNDMIRRQQAEKGSIYGPSFLTPAEKEAQEKLLVEEMTLQELQEYNRSGRKVLPERLRQRFGGFPADLETGVRARVEDGARSLAAAELGQDVSQGLTSSVRPTYEPIAPTPDSSAEPVEAPAEVRVPDSMRRPPPPAPVASSEDASAERALAQGVASLMGGQRPGAPGLTPALEAAILKQITDDPMAMARARQGMIPGLNPERMAARQKDLAERERLYEQAKDPKRQAMDQLIAFLASGAGRTTTGGALAAGAAGYSRTAAAQEAALRSLLKDRETAREGIRALEDAREMEVTRAGLGGLEAGEQARRAGVTAGAGLTGDQMRTGAALYAADLQAETARLNEQSRALDRALARGDMNRRAVETQYSILSQRRAQIREAVEKRLDASMPMDIRILASKANKTSEDLEKLRQYETARDAAISRSLAETDNVLASVEAKLGVPQTASRAAPSVDTTGFRLTGVRNR
jgi:hypothetical protein